MENAVFECNPNFILSEVCQKESIPHDIYEYYKNKYAIFFIIEHGPYEIKKQKLKEVNSSRKSDFFKKDLAEWVIHYGDEYLIDYLNYKWSGIIRELMEDCDYIGNFCNIKNLYWLIKNYGLDFRSNNGLNYIEHFLKQDKKTLLKILDDKYVYLNKTIYEIIDSFYQIEDIDVLKMLIKYKDNSSDTRKIHLDLMFIALVNNNKSYIEYYLNNYTKRNDLPLKLIDHTLLFEFDNFDDTLEYGLNFKYVNKYKTNRYNRSKNLDLVLDKLKEVYDSDTIINFITRDTLSCLMGPRITGIIRFDCINILEYLVDKRDWDFICNIINADVVYDLVRYGSYKVFKYITEKKKEILTKEMSHIYRLESLLSYALYNSDDRITKWIMSNSNLEMLNNYMGFIFLSSESKISIDTKLRKLRLILNSKIKCNEEFLISSALNNGCDKLAFWLASKIYNNQLTNDNGSDCIIQFLLKSKFRESIDKLFSILSPEYNYWSIIINIIRDMGDHIFYDEIIRKISFKLENIKNHPDFEDRIVKQLSQLKYYNIINKDSSADIYDSILKLLKSCNIDLNKKIRMPYNSYNTALCPDNINFMKIGIKNGLSFPNYFNQLIKNHSFYSLFTHNIKPYTMMYVLMKRLQIRREIKNRKIHKSFFENTNVNIKSRPPIDSKPVLKRGGALFYEDLNSFVNSFDVYPSNFINPKHISPLELLDLCKKEVVITSKIDGKTIQNIDKNLVYPSFPYELSESVIDAEYVKELDMYLVFGIRNRESVYNCIFNDYQELKNYHSYTKYDNDCMINCCDYGIIKNKILNEFKKIIKFREDNPGKSLWFPKKFWIIYDKELCIEIINIMQKIQEEIDSELEYGPMEKYLSKLLIKTDGFILHEVNSKKDHYKLKPSYHMTVDLMFDGEWKDKQGNDYKIKSEFTTHGIYRCYFIDGEWTAKDYRPYKEHPNPKDVVKTVMDYHFNPWNVSDLLGYSVPTYYQELKPNKTIRGNTLDKIRWINTFIKNNNKVLDIGCGYLTKVLWNNPNLEIDGIDNDVKIFEKYRKLESKKDKKVFLQDIRNNWNFQDDKLKKWVNKNMEHKMYDVILMNFTIHNVFHNSKALQNLMKNVNLRSNTKTKLLVSFLDKDILFRNKDNINFKDGGFFKKQEEKCELTFMSYYYPWRHYKPIREPIVNTKQIVESLNVFGWYLKCEYHNMYQPNESGYREMNEATKRLVFQRINIS